MARIFLEDNKLHKILPSSFHEGEFEHIITLNAPNLYPDYYVFPFKKKVSSPTGGTTPDLVFVAKDYADWYIVEVEMAYHSFSSHVEPQMARLATAQYDTGDVINYACAQCTSLDINKTTNLFHNEPPRLLLILNEMKTDWASELYNKYGVITSVFDVFHCHHSTLHISPTYRAYGIALNYPVYSLSVTTTCSVHPYLAYLGVDDNSNLRLKPGDEVVLEYDNCLTFWRSVEGPGKAIWLRMDGRDAFIDKDKSYQITKLRDNSLLLNAI